MKRFYKRLIPLMAVITLFVSVYIVSSAEPSNPGAYTKEEYMEYITMSIPEYAEQLVSRKDPTADYEIYKAKKYESMRSQWYSSHPGQEIDGETVAMLLEQIDQEAKAEGSYPLTLEQETKTIVSEYDAMTKQILIEVEEDASLSGLSPQETEEAIAIASKQIKTYGFLASGEIALPEGEILGGRMETR